MCLAGLVKIGRIPCSSREISLKKKDFDILWSRVTLTFDLLTPKVDGFMPLPRGAKSVYSFTKYRVFTSFATNEMTDGQTNERPGNNMPRGQPGLSEPEA